MLCTQDGEIAFSYLIYIPCSHLENNERVGHEARFNQIYKIKVFRGEMWYFNFMRNFSINQKYFALSPSLTWISKNICFINDHHKDNRMPLIWKTFFFLAECNKFNANAMCTLVAISSHYCITKLCMFLSLPCREWDVWQMR